MSHVCETCGQAVHKRPPRPLDMIDQLYLAFGKCCAGCDFWKYEPTYTRPLGHCQKKPNDTVTAFDIDGPGSVTRFKTYERTEAKFVCELFQDTFDWTTLGVESPAWLQREQSE